MKVLLIYIGLYYLMFKALSFELEYFVAHNFEAISEALDKLMY